ncbi:MAG: universal stress protein [Candidatus Hodarchaeota archaeon]
MFFIYSKILLAFDGSEDSIEAAKQVIELQKKWNSKVVAFYSIGSSSFQEKKKSSTISTTGRSNVSFEKIFGKTMKTSKNKGKKILRKIRKIFRRKNIKIETRLIKNERPEEYIERIVTEEKYDLVALGFRSEHSKSKKITMGKWLRKYLIILPVVS